MGDISFFVSGNGFSSHCFHDFAPGDESNEVDESEVIGEH